MTRSEIPPSERCGLPPVLEGFLAGTVLLVGLCVLSEAIATLILKLPPPYGTPLLSEHFPDLYFYLDRFGKLHQLSFFEHATILPFMYPAPVALPYAFFCWMQRPLATYLFTVLGAFVLAAVLVGRALLRAGLRLSATALLMSAVLCFSFPMAFLLKQANMEAVVWMILSLGFVAFFRGRSYTAAAMFGVAGAMKLFPFVFLGLLLARRRYREVVWAVLVAVVLTLGSLWFIYPEIGTTWRLVQDGLEQFRVLFALHLRWPEMGFDHSLWALIKRVPATLPREDRLAPYLTGYMAIVAMAGIALFVLRIRKLPAVNQVLCLTVASVLLPPTSFDYTLVHLYAPWALLCLLAVGRYRRGESFRGMGLAFACFAVLMAPESEFFRNGHRLDGPIKAVTLLVLFWVGLRYRFEDEMLEVGNGERVRAGLRDGAAAA